MSGYLTFYQGEKESFNEQLVRELKIKDNLLYEILYEIGAIFNKTKEEKIALGKNLLDYINLISKTQKIFGKITLRGPVQIVGENQ